LSGKEDTSPQADLAVAWRDCVEASLRYWGRLGRLALEGAAAIRPLVAEQRPDAARTAATPASEAGLPRTILLESEVGRAALGVFVVENTTAQQLSIPIRISPFVADDGSEAQPAVVFRPDVITLGPSEQLVVQVVAAIDETLEPGVRYRGEISVPELSETRIPIVVRRRPSALPPAPPPGNGRAARRPRRQAKAQSSDS
jgi:hypothetical protein